jgi:hypothetical protein
MDCEGVDAVDQVKALPHAHNKQCMLADMWCHYERILQFLQQPST